VVDIPLQFPDIGNALATGMQLRNANIQGEREQEQLNMLRRRSALGPDVQAAITGDSKALGRVAAVDPDYALKLGPIMETMGAKERTKLQAGADFTYKAANAVLQADPADRPAVYRQMIAQGAALGHDLSKLPQEYTPQLDGQLRSWRQMAIPVLDQWKVEQDRPQPMVGGGGAPTGAPAPGGGGGPYGGAIANIESSGAPNGGYGAVGPAANEKGNRAYGKYQVMDFNVGPWTQEILGKAMTPQEFAASPQAQDAVFAGKFGQYVRKYGSPQAAARAWFAGEGGMSNPNATDVNGMSVANYERKFSAALPPGGGQAAPGVPGPVASPVPSPPGFTPPPTAQMPGPPTGLIPPGPPPAQMPNGMPPQIAQGSGGDGSGNPVPPVDQGLTRGLKLPPGARMMGIKGVPVVKDGNVLIVHPDGTQDWLPLPPRKEPGPQPPAGPFAGNAMEAQYANVLAAGASDPAVRSTFAYAQAYAHASAPRTTIDEQGRPVTIQPNVSHLAPPTFQQGAAPPGAAAGPAPQAAAGGPSVAQSGPPSAPVPPAIPPRTLPGGQTITVGEGAPKGPSATEMAKLRDMEAEGGSIIEALNDFKKEYKAAGLGDRVKSAFGVTTSLNTSYNVAALLAKGEALFNLGVLNGPDLDLIRRTIPDPSTVKAGTVSAEDMEKSVDKVASLIKTRLDQKKKSLGIASTPAAPGGDDLRKKYGLE